MMEIGLLGFLRRRRHERPGYMLYTEAVRRARDPALYTTLGVPDTMDGRFDLVGLHVALLVNRLHAAPPPGKQLAQAVFDAMFADMDRTLRELGVGDMSVARRNKEMWEAFHGRAMAYEAALADPDAAALPAVLARNVWRDQAPPGAPETLAAAVRAHHAALAAEPMEAFAAGEAHFAEAVAA